MPFLIVWSGPMRLDFSLSRIREGGDQDEVATILVERPLLQTQNTV